MSVSNSYVRRRLELSYCVPSLCFLIYDFPIKAEAGKNMTHQIYIVEDHPVMRQGYATLIEQEIDLKICGETGSSEEARRRIPEMKPDLAIIDLSLREGGGLDLIKDLLAKMSDLLVLVISMHDEALYADRVLQAGARGYLMKNEAHSEVIHAIRRVLEGGIYLSKDLSTRILLRYAGKPNIKNNSPLEGLSDREIEVFEHMGQGMTTREIAEKLMLSPKTIDSYRTRLKEKLSIDTNAQLRRQAVVWVEQYSSSGGGGLSGSEPMNSLSQSRAALRNPSLKAIPVSNDSVLP